MPAKYRRRRAFAGMARSYDGAVFSLMASTILAPETPHGGSMERDPPYEKSSIRQCRVSASPRRCSTGCCR